ncbi:MAG: TIGR03617 family F420-dependent LLM class oxidoreductase [Chloroflexi bacterium]|nr:TIGR03617 family F420-dependent LLM class oxidoreductase [Chloroflexota bacterium]
MKVELMLDVRDLRTIEAQAEAAEAAGADAVVTAEGYSDALLAAMLAARATRRASVATGIVVAFPRSPMATAIASWNLQDYSQGRFELGLGSQVKGHVQRRFSTEWVPPVPRMREYVLALRAIFECWEHGGPLNFSGKHYSFSLMSPELRPRPLGYPPIPISVAAVNPFMLRMAAELCDGVRLHHFVSRRFLTDVIRKDLERGLMASGRSWHDIDISGGALIGIGRDEVEVRRVREDLRRRVGFYGSTRTYAGSLEIYGWQDLAAKLHECSISNRWQEMPGLVPDEVLDEFAIVGTYAEAGKTIVERLGGIVNRVTLTLPLSSPADTDAAAGLIAEIKQRSSRLAAPTQPG